MPTIETTNTVSTEPVETTTLSQEVNKKFDDLELKFAATDIPKTMNQIDPALVDQGAINAIPKEKPRQKISSKAEEFFNKYEEQFKLIEPVQSGLVKNPEKGSIGFWGTLGDMALSAAQGASNAAYNQATFLTDKVLANSALNVLGGAKTKFSEEEVLSFKDFTPKFVSEEDLTKENLSNGKAPVFYNPKTLAGNITESMSQFITGFLGPNKVLKMAGVGGTFGLWSLRGVTAGAITDLTVWDPHQERLSNWLSKAESPLLNNVVTNYLAANPEDTEWEGRVKNVLEGMFAGTVVSAGFKGAALGVAGAGKLSTFLGIKAVKKANGIADVTEKQKVYEDAGKAIKEVEAGNVDAPIVKLQIADGNPAININKLKEVIETGQKAAKEDSESFIKSILNTKSFNSSQHVLDTLDTISELFTAEQREFLKNNVLRNKTAEDLAYLLARDKEEILKIIPRISAESEKAVVQMLATKIVVQDLTENFIKVSQKHVLAFGKDKNLWTKEAQQEILSYTQIIRDSVEALKKQIRTAARVTQAGNVKVGKAGTRIDAEEFANIVKEFDGDAITIANKIVNAKPVEVLNIVAKTKFAKSVEIYNSAMTNSLLSATGTQKLQILSSLQEMIIRPLEMIGGGIVRGDHRTVRLGFAQWQGLMHNFKDTWKAVRIAFKQSDPVLDPKNRSIDGLEIINGKAVKPISGANLGFDGRVGTAIDWIGKFVEFPQRLMITSDELFKQMNYRGRIYADAINNTMERNLSLYSKEGKANIKKIMDEAFDLDGRANVKSNPIAAKALKYAQESTLTNDIRGGSYGDWGSSIQDFLYKHPSLRFMAPFVKTPTNIWRHVENRLPVWGVYTKQMREMWNSGDPRARAEVIGRQMFGVSATLLAINYAMSNIVTKDGKTLPQLTGNGPANKDVKKRWMEYGWQPYSIGVLNEDGSVKYVQYNRMDPRFYLFGLAADIKENIENINDVDKEDMTLSAVLTIYKNTLGKAYMRGVADTFEVLASPTENTVQTLLGKIVGNAIPYGALRGEFEKTSYETRTFFDSIIQRASLGSQFLDPKRDILTGQPIEKINAGLTWNPDGILSVSGVLMGPALVGKSIDVKDDPVRYELFRLRVPFRQPLTKRNDVDLTEIKQNNQSAYDYWIERIGKTTNSSGRTLKDRLEQEINSSGYKRLQEGEDGNIGGKELTLKTIYEEYKGYAYEDMLKKYPEVQKAIDAKVTTKTNLLDAKREETKQKKLNR
jgi:hypothetical protein